jgi:hypothetical protein
MNPLHWSFPLVMLVLSLFLVGVTTVFVVIPAPNEKICDRIFAEFMATKDPVIINRNGWLLYELKCNVSRRYGEMQP